MGKKIIIGLVVLVVVVGSWFAFSGSGEAKEEMTIYKSPTCGCCVGFSGIMKSEFDVDLIALDDMQGIKDRYGIPSNMESCHTSIVGDYFVEGHVPKEAIDRLLEERPEDIKGISLPNMPAGSPGMPGVKRGDFVIYALDNDGNWEEWMRI